MLQCWLGILQQCELSWQVLLDQRWFMWCSCQMTEVLIRFGFVWVFLARKGSGCPSEGKKVWVKLEWLGAMENLASRKYAPKYQSGIRKDNLVVMVKDLKGILDMVSLDIYQIINYSSFSKKHIICLIFKRLGFFMNIKVWLCEARFYFKIRLFEISMFRLNWFRKWENIYPNRFFPDNDHKIFSSLKQLKSIPLFHVSEIFKI